MPTVTFETQCYENDYRFLLEGNRLKERIDACNYPFSKKILLINEVVDKKRVALLAKKHKQNGVIDEYYFADEYEKDAFKHFNVSKEWLRQGYYYTRCQLIGLYLCNTDYLLHFTTDSKMESGDWINAAIQKIETTPRYICATPLWNHALDGAQNEAVEDLGDWFTGYGFSDNCYLVPTKLFKQDIYHEYNHASERYPVYAGFEKFVDSYMRNHDLLRLIAKNAHYVETPIPQSILKKSKNLLKRIKNKLKKKEYREDYVVPKEQRSVIEAHRKNIKIYDVFTFFNELDLLEIRLNMLAPYVDYFVIIECKETFSGNPKPLYFKENKDRFKQFEDKIIYHEVTDVPKSRKELEERLKNRDLDPLEREIINYNLTSDNIPPGELHWFKEFYQKESIRKALTHLNNDDICFISDVDEIWNPETPLDFRKDNIFKLRQYAYAYYLNNRSNEPWAGTLMTKYKNIRHNCLNHLRTVTKTNYTYVPNGGWHFTNMGGVEKIKLKIESYGHQEFNNENIKSQIEKRITDNIDFVGRKFTFWVDESDLPEYIKNNKDTYEYLFRKTP